MNLSQALANRIAARHDSSVPTCSDLTIEPNAVLKAAKHRLAKVVVVGVTNDGLLYSASSHPAPEAAWLMDLAKLDLLQMANPGHG